VVQRRKHESEADLADAGFNNLDADINTTSNGLQDIRGPTLARGGAISVLCNSTASASSDESGRRRDIESRPSATGSCGVNQIIPCVDLYRALSQHGSKPSDLSHCLTLRAQGYEKCGSLSLRGSSVDDLREYS
jgi:hypothetical protein